MKPERWNDPAKKIFPHQVGFTAPPHDFEAKPHDFPRIAPEGVGGHVRLPHARDYAHQLEQRVDNFPQLEEVVHCMPNTGADVVGSVGKPMVSSDYALYWSIFRSLKVEPVGRQPQLLPRLQGV